MQPKWWLKSWTVWSTILGIAGSLAVVILEHFHPGLFGDEIAGAARGVLVAGALALALRFKTAQPVTLRRGP
jgi:hypothetical protein